MSRAKQRGTEIQGRILNPEPNSDSDLATYDEEFTNRIVSKIQPLLKRRRRESRMPQLREFCYDLEQKGKSLPPGISEQLPHSSTSLVNNNKFHDRNDTSFGASDASKSDLNF